MYNPLKDKTKITYLKLLNIIVTKTDLEFNIQVNALLSVLELFLVTS